MIENVVARTRGILLQPEETWAQIKEEQTTIAQIYQDYLVFLAAIPAIAGFLGSLFTGANFFKSLFWGILYYLLSLAGVWLVAQAIQFLAANFKIAHDEITVFKLVAYSYTAFFVAGIFFLIPPLYWLSLVALYGFYIFYLGTVKLIECPKEEQANFIILSFIVIVVISACVFVFPGLLSGTSAYFLRLK